MERVSQFVERHEEALQLSCTAAAASALTASAILGYQACQRRHNSTALKNELLSEDFQHVKLTSVGTIQQQKTNEHDEALIQEQLARNIAFLGEDGMKRVRESFVVVVGAGNVGSWAALMLLRSGVQHLRLIDPKRLTRRNMGNHAVAGQDDIGMTKVYALQTHLHDIAPFSKIECCTERLSTSNMATLLQDKPSFIVDTMTNIIDKVALVEYCHANNIKIISSMSPGAKADPTRIQVADISETMEDPLARAFRRRLKMLKIDRGIPVVISTDRPLDTDKSTLQDFRTRQLASLGSIDSMYGMVITTHIILHLAEFAALPAQPIRLRDNLFNRIMYEASERETKNYGSSYPFTVHDVVYVFEEIWHGKSVISGPQDRLTLARWDRSKPLSLGNAVCMNRDEARAHDGLPADVDLRKHYGDVDYVNKQFEIEAKFQKLWA
ncbi:hypothetical protein K492DRAFT_210540 [Lichtheimia hyalospora FSU 10163]|nr:hypothetical protein K492DRAFT_210540 [Lichtheimia hyalospora FSU 10163]